MECPFQVGDEVVCISPPECDAPSEVGGIYVVERVWLHPECGPALDLIGIDNGCADAAFWGHNPSRFRKVQKPKTDLSIESFLTIKPGFEEPRKVVTPQREKEEANAR